MSIQHYGRYSEFLARSQIPSYRDQGLHKHFDQRSMTRTIINPHPLGHALVLTCLSPYPGNQETINKATLALAHPGHMTCSSAPSASSPSKAPSSPENCAA